MIGPHHNLAHRQQDGHEDPDQCVPLPLRRPGPRSRTSTATTPAPVTHRRPTPRGQPASSARQLLEAQRDGHFHSNVTDGSSSTIAFSEGLVGGEQMEQPAWRNEVTSVAQTKGVRVQDAWTILPKVIQALQACSAKAMQYNRVPALVEAGCRRPGDLLDPRQRWPDDVQHHRDPQLAAVSVGRLHTSPRYGLGNSVFANATSMHPAAATSSSSTGASTSSRARSTCGPTGRWEP